MSNQYYFTQLPFVISKVFKIVGVTCIQLLTCVTYNVRSYSIHTKYKYKVMRGLFWATLWVTPELVLVATWALNFTGMKVLKLGLTLVRQ